jgi:hypothetical protein
MRNERKEHIKGKGTGVLVYSLIPFSLAPTKLSIDT